MIGKLRPETLGCAVIAVLVAIDSVIDSIAGMLLGWVAYRIALAVVPPEEESAPDEEGMMRVGAGSGA